MEVKIKRYKSGKNSGCVYKNEVKLDYYDDWSADWTIAQIAAPLLVQLQQKKQGAPFVDDEDVPEELRSTSCAPKENEWDTDDNHFKRWDWVLSEIVFAMQEIGNGNENEPEMFTKVGDMKWGEPEANGCRVLISTGLEEIHGMRKVHDAYKERVQNGCMLFGKYFMSLWS